MALSTATKEEIKQQVQLGIEIAFRDLEIPPPDNCIVESARLDKLEKLSTNHEAFINGNGAQGAKTDIQLIKQSQLRMEEWKKSVDAKTWAIILMVLGTLITNIINLYGHVP